LRYLWEGLTLARALDPGRLVAYGTSRATRALSRRLGISPSRIYNQQGRTLKSSDFFPYGAARSLALAVLPVAVSDWRPAETLLPLHDSNREPHVVSTSIANIIHA